MGQPWHGEKWHGLFAVQGASSALERLTSSDAALPAQCSDCPVALVHQLAVHSFRVDDSTVRDGNCGVHAFVISMLDQAARNSALRSNAAVGRLRRCNSVAGMLKLGRTEALAWLQEHKHSILCEGMPIHRLCSVVSGKSFSDYMASMSADCTWADTALMQGLACAYGADLCLFLDSGPALLGQSLVQADRPSDNVMVPVALANDFHYWGVLEIVLEEASPVDKGDFCATSIFWLCLPRAQAPESDQQGSR